MEILAVGAHPDDVEIGCGGTLLKHMTAGDRVHVLVLTCGEGGNVSPKTRRAEAALAGQVYTSIRFGDLHAIEMCYVRQSFVEVVERAVDDVHPDRVYCHCQEDLHQNHVTAARCTLIATKKIPDVLSFRLPSTTSAFSPNAFSDISEIIEGKVSLLGNFVSQAGKDYLSREHILAVAAYHAVEARLSPGSYAEAFFAERRML